MPLVVELIPDPEQSGYTPRLPDIPGCGAGETEGLPPVSTLWMASFAAITNLVVRRRLETAQFEERAKRRPASPAADKDVKVAANSKA